MEEIRNPVKAIRAKCLDCCCGQKAEVADCPAQDCPLWPFRFGTNPYRSKPVYSEATKENLRQQAAMARLSKSLDYKQEKS